MQYSTHRLYNSLMLVTTFFAPRFFPAARALTLRLTCCSQAALPARPNKNAAPMMISVPPTTSKSVRSSTKVLYMKFTRRTNNEMITMAPKLVDICTKVGGGDGSLLGCIVSCLRQSGFVDDAWRVR